MSEMWMQKAFSKNKGKLHRKLGVPAGQPIPESKLEAATHSSNPELKKEAVAAKTAKRYAHKGGKNSHKGKKKIRRSGRR